jgi:hypothetical protein
MVIAKKDGIIFVTLADGEFLPTNLNSEKVVVFRQGDSTNRELKMVKELGKLATPDLLKPPDEPFCNYSGDGNPLHEHTDGTWWYYDETWAYENGPFATYELGYESLALYCADLQAIREKDFTVEFESGVQEDQ